MTSDKAKFAKFMNENSGTTSGRVPDDWQPPAEDAAKLKELLDMANRKSDDKALRDECDACEAIAEYEKE